MIAAVTGLATLSVARPNGSVQSTLVNAGIVEHPADGALCVGIVVRSAARKMDLLRDTTSATVLWRDGWAWWTVEGPVEVVGPRDPAENIPDLDLPALLRAIFVGASGTHEDWLAFDAVMADEERAAILIRPDRVYTNG